jgi:hypothetical protein
VALLRDWKESFTNLRTEIARTSWVGADTDEAQQRLAVILYDASQRGRQLDQRDEELDCEDVRR